jgi:hypothetical protein
MAYNASNEERIELASVQKNNRGDVVRVAKIRNKNTGNESVDIRLFYTNDEDELSPTAKGVRFSTESLIDVIMGLVQALEPNEVDDLKEELDTLIVDDNEGDDSEDLPEED